MKLGGADGMPTSLFDPRWQEPAVAARIAFLIHCRIPFEDGAVPLAPEPVDAPAALTDARSFALTQVIARDDDARVRFKGGSYGELHRRYAFGTHTANFHAQAVAFGADSRGRYFLSAVVGRFDGPWGNDGTLAVSFFAGAVCAGTVRWHKSLDPTGDHRVVIFGRDDTLKDAFENLDRADVTFTARTGVESPADAATSPKLSRARRSALAAALAQARARGDAAEVARLEEALAGSGGKP